MNWSRRSVLLSGVAAALMGIGPVAAEGAVEPMANDRFWTIIDGTAGYQSDPDLQIEALAEALRRLSPAELATFAAAFDGKMDESFRWDLWGAAYVVHGGSSDDGFDYFRTWLISRGRAAFEQVLQDPDSLADLELSLVDGFMEFESFAYVAADVWAERSDPDSGEMPRAVVKHPLSMPAGLEFDEDPVELAKRYPRLWRKYGKRPLG